MAAPRVPAAADVDSVLLIVENEEILGSREALATCSDYFQAMFNSKMKEANAQSIVIKDMPASCIKWIVAYSTQDTKTGARFHDINDACQILHTCCVLQCAGAVKATCKYLTSRLSADNCLTVMALADMHALSHLYYTARRKALWDFKKVIKCKDFQDLSKDCLIDYLSCNMLNVTTESEVLESLLIWLEYDVEKRRDDFTEVLSYVRLHQVGSSNLNHFLEKDSIADNTSARNLIQQAIMLGLPPKLSRHVPEQLWVTGEWSPKPDNVASKVVCVHGSLDAQFELLDNLPINNPHSVSATAASERLGFSVTRIDKDVYIFGGGTLNCRLSHDCWKYDTFRATWTEIGEIPIPRRHHSAVAINNRYIMLIGGFGKYRVMLDTVIIYDTHTGEWFSCPKLNTAVYSAAVCVCKDHVYVIKHSMERRQLCVPNHDEEEDEQQQWQSLTTSLPFEIGLYSAVSVGEKIYLLGKNICSLVCLDTQSLTFDTLATFQPFVDRHSPVLCLKDSQTLLIVSGQERDDNLRTIIEEFDINEKKIVAYRDLGWVIMNPQVIMVPYYPKF